MKPDPTQSAVQMNEHIWFSLSADTYALFADRVDAATAVVFVHGFEGHSVKTWLAFQTLIDDPAISKKFAYWWNQCDLFFYGYKSTEQFAPNVSALLDFLDTIYPSIKSIRVRQLLANTDRRYRQLILVGHSAGCVIIRAAIIERADARLKLPTSHEPLAKLLSDPLLQARLRLFAPALFGTNVSGWKGVLLKTPAFKSLLEMALSRSGAYKQLQSDSPVLHSIRQRAEDLARQFPKVPSFTARNLFGMKEEIVSAWKVCSGDEADCVHDQSHASVCKPSRSYLRPLEFVREDASLAIAS